MEGKKDQLCVAHVIGDLDTGGAEVMLYKLLKGSAGSNVSAEVIVLTGEGVLAERIRDLGVTVTCLDPEGTASFPGLLWKLIRTLRYVRPDVIQGWMYHSNLLAALAWPFSGCKPLFWGIRAANLDPAWNKRRTLMVNRVCGWLSGLVPRRVICNSDTGLILHVQSGYRRSNMVMIPNGFEIPDRAALKPAGEALKHELSISGSARVIGMVGRFDPLKDVGTFITAAGILQCRMDNVAFILCGEGFGPENPEIADAAEQAGITGTLRLLGWRSDIPAVMSSFGLFTLSSRGEAFPNVVGEAMSLGLSCVVTDAGDSAGIVDRTGIVVPTEDPEALAAAWERFFLKSDEERASLGQQARQRIEDHYSLSRCIECHLELYRSAAGA